MNKKLRLVSCLGFVIFLIAAPSGPLSSLSAESKTPAKDTVVDRKVEAIIAGLAPAFIEIRRDIHAHPELGYQEKRTSAIVAEYFRKLGLEVKTGIAGTGVLGILRAGKKGPVIGMRADMDALPVTEETGLPFASKEKAVIDGREVGLMHACGHDIHTAVLLGVAHVLSEIRNELAGTVLFVAQPAEESGSSGALKMLEEGLFQDLRPEAMFAFHVDDSIKAGFIKYTSGYMTANVDGFGLAIESKGCHGSQPWSCVDPIVVGAQVVTGLQVMVAREINVRKDTVITVGTFHAGTASNVIPEKAELGATIRSYGEDERMLVKEKVERLVKNICEAAGARFKLDYYIGIPSLYCDPHLLQRILPTAIRVLGGKDRVIEEPPGMGGEDFSYFAREAPSVLLWLGIVPKDLEKTVSHSPSFVADEESISVGVKVMSSIILDYLRGQTRRQPRL